MSKGIFIFDENLIKKGVIYGYEEFDIKQQLINSGDFTITIATEKNGVDLLQENSIIYATPNLSGVILEVENYQKKEGNYTIVKGKTLNAILSYRIVQSFSLESNTENIAKTLVNENLVSATDSNRNIDMTIEMNNNNGSTQEINASKQVLSNVLEEVLSVDNYGHRIYLENEQLKYDVIIPNNTAVQFSNKLYNLNEATQIKSQSGYRNVAYVDNGNTVFEYGTETGINRREIILTDNRITSPVTAGYKAQQELTSKHFKTDSIQGKIKVVGNPFVYGRDYTLGDYVTVVYRNDVYNVQVTEVEQRFSGNNGYELYLYFGKPRRSSSKKIQDIQTKAEKTDVIEAELVSSVETIETALNNKSDIIHNHNLNNLSEKSYNSLTDKPTSLPADGGNADTVDGKHYSDITNYVDSGLDTHIADTNDPHDIQANQVDYDNTTSGLTATNTQAAIDEVDDNLDAHKAEMATQEDLGHVKLQEGWIQATLQNGWTGEIKYAKNDLGIVSLAGSMQRGSLNENTAIAILPFGYRPVYDLPFGVYRVSSTRNTIYGFKLGVDGAIRVVNPASSDPLTDSDFMLEFALTFYNE